MYFGKETRRLSLTSLKHQKLVYGRMYSYVCEVIGERPKLSETLSAVANGNQRYIYIYIYMYICVWYVRPHFSSPCAQ